jgi:PTS system mannose-specific IID component
VAKAKLPARGAQLRSLAAASAGGLAAYLAIVFGMQQGGVGGLFLALGCLGLGVASHVLVGMKLPRYLVLYVAALLAGVAAVFL